MNSSELIVLKSYHKKKIIKLALKDLTFVKQNGRIFCSQKAIRVDSSKFLF